jgi:hypothetical protein
MNVLSLLKGIIINQKELCLQTSSKIAQTIQSLQEENEKLKRDRLT